MVFSKTKFQHGDPAKFAVLLCNLGSPEAPTASAVRRYLAEFLSDPRVVEFPRLLWLIILHGIILRFRPRRSAHAYQKIWTENGSPLLQITRAQCEALRARLRAEFGERVLVDWAMRYGKPGIADTLQTLADNNVQKLVVLPLYPQYSATTSASTFDAIAQDFCRRRWLPELHFINDYHDHALYIEALAQSIETHWREHGRAEKLLLSFHGIPQRYLHNGDPYHCYCLQSSRLLRERLKLSEQECETSFQSRFGREPWLQPYTDIRIEELAAAGLKSLQVVCPGFSSDCLETLEEIDQFNRALFLKGGGERFEYIAALNAEPAHIDMMAALVAPTLRQWNSTYPERDCSAIAALQNQHHFNRKQ